MNLLDLPISQSARVSEMHLDDEQARHVRAVGVFEREEIVVLRRAPFGGPVHVRTGSGGEFALDARIAKAIDVSIGARTDDVIAETEAEEEAAE